MNILLTYFYTIFSFKLLTSHVKCNTFAVAMRKQRRLRAAAQHSSSELGSAFTLHRNCTCQSDVATMKDTQSILSLTF